MLLAAAGPLWADEQKPADAQAADEKVSYYRHVLPILREHCAGCHQPAKAGGGLVLTTLEGLKTGGESEEPGIVAGKPEASTLVQQIVASDGEQPAMPKDRPPLHSEQVELIRRWIAEGAADDTPESERVVYNAANPPKYAALPLVTSLAWSPDGTLLAVSGYHEVLLWKADGSELVGRLIGLAERIEKVAFSPDGKRLAVSGGAPGRLGEIQIWDVDGRKLLLSHAATYDTLYGASWSPDGKLVFFGGTDNVVRGIEAETGKQVLYMGSHNDWVHDTVVAADGISVFSVGRDMTVKMTDIPTERFVGNITTHTPGVLRGGMNAVDRRPGKTELLAAGSDGAPKLFKMETTAAPAGGGNPNQIREYPAMAGRVFSACFSSDGGQFVAGSSLDGKGEVWIYETDSGKLLRKLEGQQGGVYAVAWSPDGKTIASGGFDGRVRLSDPATGKLTKEFVPVPLEESAAAVSQDGK